MDMRVIGCMSGTSYDAVDAVATDLSLRAGVLTAHILGQVTTAIPAHLRRDISALLPPQPTTVDAVCRLDTRLGRLFGTAIADCHRRAADGHADLAVCHGQTVFHWVEDGRAQGTLQLGAAGEIAQACGLPVVTDLRSRDVAAGGQGAPLVSLLDALLILAPTEGARPEAARTGVLNLGGIANITVPAPTAPSGVVAYDLGPANALIDAAVSHYSGGAATYDEDGARAARGRVQPELLARLTAHPYYRQPAPKSTGKEVFHAEYLSGLTADLDLTPDDVVATVTELTAVLVAQACEEHDLGRLLVSGGGTLNPTLMTRIRERCGSMTVSTTDTIGLPSRAKEAFAFAVLGYLTVHGIPGTLPGVTGASRTSVLGSVTPGPQGWQLPPSGTAPPTSLRLLT